MESDGVARPGGLLDLGLEAERRLTTGTRLLARGLKQAVLAAVAAPTATCQCAGGCVSARTDVTMDLQ